MRLRIYARLRLFDRWMDKHVWAFSAGVLVGFSVAIMRFI